jgi:hypothetical protein
MESSPPVVQWSCMGLLQCSHVKDVEYATRHASSAGQQVQNKTYKALYINQQTGC